MSKKLKKALAIGLAGMAASKLMGGKKEEVLKKYVGADKTGKLPAGDASVAENIAIFDRGMDKIAKAGGVSRMKSGSYVMARGCKIGKKKPTRIT